jgi:glycosyltransferase involved in cell wall biosynthesis
MKKSNVKRILFVHYSFSSFVKNDFEILKKHFNVKTLQWRGKKDIFKIARNVLKSDITFSWFAGDHAYLTVLFSRLFRKKSVVVVGGVDVAKIPELNYGQFTLKWHKKKLTRYALKKADIVLAVSDFNKKEILNRATPKNLLVVYNGVNTEQFKPKGKKEKIIVTIGSVTDQGIKLKGLGTFAKASIHFPDYKFVIIGETEESSVQKLKEINPNLTFTGKVTHDEVSSWLQRAKIYCQLSYVESFGMSVAEAMSCECIPVVTNRGALPELVGDTGFFVEYNDEVKTVDAIKKAIDSQENISKKFRERIIKMFSIKNRGNKIINIISQELKG